MMPAKSTNATVNRYDAAAVKAAARGREYDIMADVAGIPREYHTSQHGPCPKCAGKDRFRFFDDGSYGAICNQCLTSQNGDYIAVAMWYTGWDFPETISRIGDYLGVEPAKANGKAHNANGTTRPAKGKKATGPAIDQTEWIRPLSDHMGSKDLTAGFLAAKPPITYRSLVRSGAFLAKWNGLVCIAFPAFVDPHAAASGWLIMRADGQDLPAFRNLPARNKHNLKNSSDGWNVVGGFPALQEAHTVWVCEGPPDALALDGILPDGEVAIYSICGSSPRKNLPMDLFKGKVVNVIPDADTPGQEGAAAFAGQAAHHAAEVRVVHLPYEITPTKGKDLRDWLTEGGTIEQLIEMAEGAEPVSPADRITKKPQQSEFLKNLRHDANDLDPRLPEHRTDIANAKRLIDAHGNSLAYCHPWVKFLIFDETRWKIDDEGLPGCWMQSVIENLITATQHQLELELPKNDND